MAVVERVRAVAVRAVVTVEVVMEEAATVGVMAGAATVEAATEVQVVHGSVVHSRCSQCRVRMTRRLSPPLHPGRRCWRHGHMYRRIS